MRLSRLRLTVLRMMILVALVAMVLGMALGLTRRRSRLIAISLEHVGPAAEDGGTLIITAEGPAYVGLKTEKGRWHEEMRRRYDYYGHRPWLPLPPDPPEPD
jgi:hypothetical protein